MEGEKSIRTEIETFRAISWNFQTLFVADKEVAAIFFDGRLSVNSTQ